MKYYAFLKVFHSRSFGLASTFHYIICCGKNVEARKDREEKPELTVNAVLEGSSVDLSTNPAFGGTSVKTDQALTWIRFFTSVPPYDLSTGPSHAGSRNSR